MGGRRAGRDPEAPRPVFHTEQEAAELQARRHAREVADAAAVTRTPHLAPSVLQTGSRPAAGPVVGQEAKAPPKPEGLVVPVEAPFGVGGPDAVTTPGIDLEKLMAAAMALAETCSISLAQAIRTVGRSGDAPVTAGGPDQEQASSDTREVRGKHRAAGS